MPLATFLPFHERFHEALRDGTKTMTCRTKRYGVPGDLLETPVGRIQLVAVERVSLLFVMCWLYAFEGFDDPGEFQRVWCELHPGRGWDPDQKVWLHAFAREGP